MTDSSRPINNRYKVVINHELQYAMWPQHLDNPRGWRDVGIRGAKTECLAYIEKVWTDMRPLSLRHWMAELHETVYENDYASSDFEPTGDTLVETLCSSEQAVECVLRPTTDHRQMQAAVADGHVQIRFLHTQGGTELTVRIDRESSELSALIDQDHGNDVILVGELELDFQPLSCRITIDLATFKGSGKLHRRKQPA